MQSLCNQSVTRKMSWLVGRVAEVMINAPVSLDPPLSHRATSHCPPIFRAARISSGADSLVGSRSYEGRTSEQVRLPGPDRSSSSGQRPRR
jgi:hypothetical protein